jgi:hypothetical protein
MECPQCHNPLSPEDVRCAHCGLVVGAERGSKGVPTWVWVLVGAGVLLVIVPCGCVGLFLFLRAPASGPVTVGASSGPSSMSSSVSPDAPELAPLIGALRAWADEHEDAPPERLEELLATRADGQTWFEGDELPRDRHGNAYDYRPATQSDGWRVEVWTLGADGVAGGEGEDADELVFESSFTRQ